jgi:hypothetical protein
MAKVQTKKESKANWAAGFQSGAGFAGNELDDNEWGFWKSRFDDFGIRGVTGSAD